MISLDAFSGNCTLVSLQAFNYQFRYLSGRHSNPPHRLCLSDMWKPVFPLLLFILPASETLQSGFSVGRISEGQFEYSELNGWMTPRRARSLCENNSECGGFTYKVKQLSTTFNGQRPDYLIKIANKQQLLQRFIMTLSFIIRDPSYSTER